MSDDPFDLERFVQAQAGVIDQVMAELAAGRKRTHWIWFIFPQEAGLGTSEMSRRYAIGSLDEARAYIQHPVLGPRLRRCLELLHGKDARAVLGDLDAMKLRSCLRLFLQVAPDDPVIQAAAAEHGR